MSIFENIMQHPKISAYGFNLLVKHENCGRDPMQQFLTRIVESPPHGTNSTGKPRLFED